MTFLLFQIGPERYAMEAALVVEVLPRLQLKALPQAMAAVAGVFDYHGLPVPVVDLNAMALGRAARESLSTRVVVVRYTAADGSPKFLGLLAEMATEIARYNPVDFQETGVSVPGAPYLGPVVSDSRGIVQRVDLERLLTPEVREGLWRQAGEAA